MASETQLDAPSRWERMDPMTKTAVIIGFITFLCLLCVIGLGLAELV